MSDMEEKREDARIKGVSGKKIEFWYVVIHVQCVFVIVWYLLFHYSLYGGIYHSADLLVTYMVLATVSAILAVTGKKAKMERLTGICLAGLVFWIMMSYMTGRAVSDYFHVSNRIGTESCELAGLLYLAFTLIFVRKNYEKICVRKDVFSRNKSTFSQKEDTFSGKKETFYGKESLQKEQPERESGSVHQVRYSMPQDIPARGDAAEQIDINTCSADELADVPGISLAAAARMVELRDRRGGFSSVDEFIVEAGVKPHFAVKALERLTLSAPKAYARGRSCGRKLDI